MDIEKTMKNLECRGFGVKYFASGSEAADYVAGQIHQSTVGIGGSMTVHWEDGWFTLRVLLPQAGIQQTEGGE